MATPRSPSLAIATVPLMPLALFIYTGFEWVFFVSKPSFLAVIPWSDRLIALLQTPRPFIGPILATQVSASLVSLVSRRVRWLALVPSAVLLGGLVLVLADNFLYAIAGSLLRSSDVLTRIVYAVTLALGFSLF